MPEERSKYLYVDVADKLQERVRTLGPNAPLPNEHYLAKQFAVSRLTIRHALDLLEMNGTVHRQRGRGTIANPTKVVRNNFSLVWLEDDFKAQGIELETVIVAEQTNQEAPDFVRERLMLRQGATVDFVALLRLIRGQAIVFEQKYLKRGILKKLDLASLHTAAWHEAFLAGTGTRLVTVQVDTEIGAAGGGVATALGAKPGTLVISQRYTHFDKEMTSLEAGVASYRLDRCTFRTEGEISYLHMKSRPKQR